MTSFVAILNLTPDSFSDGGHITSLESARARITYHVQCGAQIIDVGAESTRPGATPLSPEMEWERLSPLLSSLIAHTHSLGARISLDTRHLQNAWRALDLGVDWINAVEGASPELWRLLHQFPHARCVLMHHCGVPADPNVTLPQDLDPCLVIRDWARAMLTLADSHALVHTRLILDPGLGFGKNTEQCWQLMRRVQDWKFPGIDWLVGHSRKRFLEPTIPAQDRGPHTHALTAHLIAEGVEFVRLHEVRD